MTITYAVTVTVDRDTYAEAYGDDFATETIIAQVGATIDYTIREQVNLQANGSTLVEVDHLGPASPPRTD